MNTATINRLKLRKGDFVTMTTPVPIYSYSPDNGTMPADTVYKIIYVSKSNPPVVRAYSRTTGCITINPDNAVVVNTALPAPKVGDIFAADWGYEQTQTMWFKVIAVSGKFATLAELGENRKYDGGMSGQATVNVNDIRENTKKYKIKYTSDKTPCFRITSYAVAFPADPTESRFFSEWH